MTTRPQVVARLCALALKGIEHRTIWVGSSKTDATPTEAKALRGEGIQVG